ncbi:MAG: polysaccharide deacetylase family protein [Christensenellales bacterium]
MQHGKPTQTDSPSAHWITYTFAPHSFLCGFLWADKSTRQQVKAIAARGNEVGNHSSTHPHMNQLSAADIRKELEKYDDTIEKLLGYRTKAFRCPYGEYNDNVITTGPRYGGWRGLASGISMYHRLEGGAQRPDHSRIPLAPKLQLPAA